MSTIRNTKKEVAYLTGEVISNCYMAIYFQSETVKDELLAIVEQAIELHNNLIEKINHPAEKHNPSLVRKHYRSIETQMIEEVDAMFEKISAICQK